MFNWFWKRLGYHVCEEFTRWANLVELVHQQTPIDGCMVIFKQTNFYQQRYCTICGKVFQRPVKHCFLSNQPTVKEPESE